MSKPKSDQDLHKHKNKAIKKIEGYLDSLINSEDKNFRGKASKLCCWLNDYMRFLEYEPRFNPSRLRRYKRGEIIKAHLGYNIGSEEGGLHYCLVIDKNNSIYSPVITIVPLTSVKPNKDLKKLRKGEVFLGNELFTNLSSKISMHAKHIADDYKYIESETKSLKSCKNNFKDRIDELEERIFSLDKNNKLLEKMGNEIYKMKKGSIALTNQITTISKIRIYDPKTNYDVLSGIKLSNEKLDAIDEKIASLYTNLK